MWSTCLVRTLYCNFYQNLKSCFFRWQWLSSALIRLFSTEVAMLKFTNERSFMHVCVVHMRMNNTTIPVRKILQNRLKIQRKINISRWYTYMCTCTCHFRCVQDLGRTNLFMCRQHTCPITPRTVTETWHENKKNRIKPLVLCIRTFTWQRIRPIKKVSGFWSPRASPETHTSAFSI